MRTKHSVIRRPGVVAASIAVGLALTLAGCGGVGGKDRRRRTCHAAERFERQWHQTGEGSVSSSPTQVLAQMKGEGGVTVTISRAARDSSGFVTVEGTLTNDGT